MVKHGDFELVLIDAVTSLPLQEKTDALGRTWVKGDDGQEFFVQVNNSVLRRCGLEVDVYVDGHDVGYSWGSVSASESDFIGIPVPQCPFPKVRAFKFERRDAHSDTPDRHVPGSGTVKAIWYETPVEAGAPMASDRVERKWCDSHSETSKHPKEASSLRATVGSCEHSMQMFEEGVWERLRIVDSITIHYTSDFGMAVRGLYTRREAGHVDD